MPTNGFGYFRYEQTIPINQDLDLGGLNPVAEVGINAAISFLGSTLFKNGQIHTFRNILGDPLGGNLASNLTITTLEVEYIDSNHIRVDDVIHEVSADTIDAVATATLTLLFELTLTKYGLTAALAFGGGILSAIGASILYAGSSYLRDLTIQTLVENNYDLDNPIILNYTPTNAAEPISGFFGIVAKTELRSGLGFH